MHGGKAVARMDYAGALKFYTEVYHRALYLSKSNSSCILHCTNNTNR